MSRFISVLLIFVTSMTITLATAQARRVALVIGINNYTEVPSLEKAVGDAQAMSDTLTKLGFDVTRALDVDRRALNIAISEFTAKLTADDVAFVHFSGHGVEIDGENFLLPADIPKPKSGHKGAVRYEAIGLQRLIDQISASGARTRLFVIDACRNNPFEQAGVRAVGSSRGLAYVAAPAGTFVMYSAGYGQLALDKLGATDTAPTSVYTRVLTQKLLVPGKSIAEVAQEVRGEVQKLAKSAGHNQRPAYYDELSANLILTPGAAPISNSLAATGEPKVSDTQIELTFWNTVKDGAYPEMFKLYLKRYPEGSFAALAKLKIKQLDQSKLANSSSAELAAKQATPAAQDDTSNGELAERDLALDIQRHLNRLGCSVGTPDGIWGRKSAGALRQFSRHGKTKLASYQSSRKVLKVLSKRNARVCPAACPGNKTWRDGKCVRIATQPKHQPKVEGVTKAPALTKNRTFRNPRIGGIPVDICVSPSASCKGAAAHRWCRSKGYTRALSWTHVIYPQTGFMTGGVCKPFGFVLCGGYNKIVCAG